MGHHHVAGTQTDCTGRPWTDLEQLRGDRDPARCHERISGGQPALVGVVLSTWNASVAGFLPADLVQTEHLERDLLGAMLHVFVPALIVAEADGLCGPRTRPAPGSG